MTLFENKTQEINQATTSTLTRSEELNNEILEYIQEAVACYKQNDLKTFMQKLEAAAYFEFQGGSDCNKSLNFVLSGVYARGLHKKPFIEIKYDASKFNIMLELKTFTGDVYPNSFLALEYYLRALFLEKKEGEVAESKLHKMVDSLESIQDMITQCRMILKEKFELEELDSNIVVKMINFLMTLYFRDQMLVRDPGRNNDLFSTPQNNRQKIIKLLEHIKFAGNGKFDQDFTEQLARFKRAPVGKMILHTQLVNALDKFNGQVASNGGRVHQVQASR